MHPVTYYWLAFVLVLFLIVRHFLRKWGLGGGNMSSGDFGLGRFFYYVAFFLLWVLPSVIVWCVTDIARRW